MLDEMAVPLVTREEADARFEAMLGRHQAEQARHRAETRTEFAQLRAETRTEFTEFRAETRAEFAKVEARFGQVEARFGQIGGRLGELDARFGEIRSDLERHVEKLRADLTWRLLLTFGGLLAASTALNRLLG